MRSTTGVSRRKNGYARVAGVPIRPGDHARAVQIQKILIVGAGVIGSFNAARLRDGGVDVTLLARGHRLTELREHGVVLEDAFSGRRSVTQVPLVDRLEPADAYDLAIVIVRRNQIPPCSAC